MIAAKGEDRFVMTTNDDHARMAGQLARVLNGETLPETARREEFEFAVTEHDRSWIDLDELPIWNDAAARPYSVIDYPMALRLPFYHRGLEEVARISEYAGLLCSKHYATLPPEALQAVAGGIGPKVLAAVENAKESQRNLMSILRLHTEEELRLLEKHLRLLQVLDRISLWLCMQNPFDSSAGSGEPYRFFAGNTGDGGVRNDGYELRWSADRSVQVFPYPFEGAVRLTWKRKELSFDLVREIGLLKAWQQTPFVESIIRIAPEGKGA